ncbi:SH3 domain-containing protein [Candidatus Babeliales bacterium]|nr:SH3 domain-containing protein [Candidatus Babeliales bacterium]
MRFTQLWLMSCLAIMLVGGQALGGTPHYHEQFLQANEQYKNKKFDAAFKLYEQIPNKSAAVLYNMGNCSYKMGNLGQALLLWRRAEKDWGMFNREELVSNINLVKAQLSKRMAEKDEESPGLVRIKAAVASLKDPLASLVRSLSLLWLQLFFLLIWVMLFIYARYFNRLRLRTVVVALYLLLAGAGGALAVKYSMNWYTYGMVVVSKAELLSGPDQSYRVLGQLYEGQEGLIKKQTHDFYKVKVGKKIGWVRKELFEKI